MFCDYVINLLLYWICLLFWPKFLCLLLSRGWYNTFGLLFWKERICPAQVSSFIGFKLHQKSIFFLKFVFFRFDDFRRFMDNLQTEVLHMEFHEFAKGTLSITELVRIFQLFWQNSLEILLFLGFCPDSPAIYVS